MKPVEYTYYRLCFKANIIESLNEDDSFIVHTPDGSFQLTKGNFYKLFPNVVASKSYQESRAYHYAKPPKKILPFLISSSTPINIQSKPQNMSKGRKKNASKDLVGDTIREKIKEIGILWRNSENNPPIKESILQSWNQVIEEWIADQSMPLIVRKETEKRGQSLIHPSGRKIIISDNTFAIWVFRQVLNNKVFTLSHIKEMLEQNKIPMVYMSTPAIREKATYSKPLGKEDAIQGWKVCHIESVGFNTNKTIEQLDINTLHGHFRKYANPNNMFILPKEIGDLGEINVFVNQQKRQVE